MAPDRAQLHAADGLPGGLAIENVVAAEQARAVGAGDLLWNGRRLSVDFTAIEAEQCERDRQHGDQREP